MTLANIQLSESAQTTIRRLVQGGKRASEFISRNVEEVVLHEAATAAVPPEEEYVLPANIINSIREPLQKHGFSVEPGQVKDFGRQRRQHYRVAVKGGYLALLYDRRGFFSNVANANSLAWIPGVFSQLGAKGILIFSDAIMIDPDYEVTREYWMSNDLELVKFLQRSYLDRFGNIDADDLPDYVGALFELRRFELAKERSTFTKLEEMQNNKEVVDRLIDILTDLANDAPLPIGAKGYLSDLINSTNWPPIFRQQRAGALTGVSNVDARALIDYAIGQGGNPNNKAYTVIGGLIEELLDQVGTENRDFLEGLVNDYSLIAR